MASEQSETHWQIDRAEQKALELSIRLTRAEDEARRSRAEIDRLRDLLTDIGKECGEYCETCHGTEMRVDHLVEMTPEQMRDELNADYGSFSEMCPDDCKDTNCFGGWRVVAP